MWPTDKFHAVLINVGIGNIDSVERSLKYLGLEYSVASSPGDLAGCTHICLPGVGAFAAGMQALIAHDMISPVRDRVLSGDAKIMGICLGMQLLGRHSEEGDCAGLDLLSFDVRLIRSDADQSLKVPHVGFSPVYGCRNEGLFRDLQDRADFYFTHSYGVSEPNFEANIGYVDYGQPLVAAFDAGAICGAQFHPEKSQSNGLRLLKNFFDETVDG